MIINNIDIYYVYSRSNLIVRKYYDLKTWPIIFK